MRYGIVMASARWCWRWCAKATQCATNSKGRAVAGLALSRTACGRAGEQHNHRARLGQSNTITGPGESRRPLSRPSSTFLVISVSSSSVPLHRFRSLFSSRGSCYSISPLTRVLPRSLFFVPAVVSQTMNRWRNSRVLLPPSPTPRSEYELLGGPGELTQDDETEMEEREGKEEEAVVRICETTSTTSASCRTSGDDSRRGQPFCPEALPPIGLVE